MDYIHPSATNFTERLSKNNSIAVTNRNLKHSPVYLNVSRAALRESEPNRLQKKETEQSIPDPSNAENAANVFL